ncbi:TadE/TadG family type IV pilus assembly protein [Alsobacter sp. SYSU BS001988]
MAKTAFSTSRFRRLFTGDERGAAAVTFAVAAIPLMLCVGVAVDYSRLVRAKATIDGAADSAVLAATSSSATNLNAEQARKAGQALFDTLSVRAAPGRTLDVDLQVKDQGLTRTATLNYTLRMQTSLASVVGMSVMSASGFATSAQSRAPYIDFYLLLDNSPSMGVGATQADIAAMVANTPDQCAFACHDTSNPSSYYDLAKKLGVTMRIDVLRTATQNLMDTATSMTATPNQFRVGVYSFGVDASNAKLTEVAPLTPILANAKAKAGSIDLMTVPYQNYQNDMQTNLSTLIPAANKEMSDPGDGSSPSGPQKVLFLVSDGVADEYNPTGCTQPLAGGGRCQQPLNPALCDAVKARGIRVAVLYTTYLPLPTNGWYTTWLQPFAGSIGRKMQECASPGLYFEVSPSQGVSEAMAALFRQAVMTSRLVK